MIESEDISLLEAYLHRGRFLLRGGLHESLGTDQLGTRIIGYRPYERGDSPRGIDPHQSARQGELMVRKYAPERGMRTVVVLDLPDRCWRQFGGVTPKGDALKRCADAMTYCLIRLGDQVGLVLAGQGTSTVEYRRYEMGIQDLSYAVEKLQPGQPGQELLPAALDTAATHFPTKDLVIVISDFLGSDWQQALQSACYGSHDVLAVQVLDPWDLELPSLGRKRVFGLRGLVSTSSAQSKQQFAQAVAEQETGIVKTLNELGVHRLRVVIDRDPIESLIDALKEAA